MSIIDATEARLNTHEAVCADRFNGLCARLKRIEGIGIASCGTIIVMLLCIILNLNP